MVMNAQWVTTSPSAVMGQSTSNVTLLHALIPVVLPSLVIYTVHRTVGWYRQRRTSQSTSSSSDAKHAQRADQNRGREPGVWTPIAFEYPEITSCLDPIKDVKPVPYRPFRWGEYHVTMGIRTMPWTEWIELDQSFSFHQRIRTFRLNQCGETVLRVLPAREDESVRVTGGAEAAKELLYELAEYLPRRYPSSFHISRLPAWASAPTMGGMPLSWQGKMPVKTIEVIETGAKYDLEFLEEMDGVEMGKEALRMISGLMQDDIAIMIEGSDGKYYFQAGVVCVPGSWRLRDKIGMPLDQIHITGDVPQFAEKLQLGMNRFFQRLPLDKPVIRNNYSIQIVPPDAPGPETPSGVEETLSNIDPEELSWAEIINGPEDDFAPGGRFQATTDFSWVSASTLRLRSERQTLRRLPRTGAIVFGIRTYRFKVEEIVRERGVAARLASAIRSWPEDVASYRGRDRFRDILLGFLDERAEKDGITGPMEGMPPYPY